MKTVIIEDEKLSAEHLATLLKKADPTATVEARFDTVKRAAEAFEKGLRADLLFVDIHLADGLSFDIFTKTEIDTPVIFTTAYDEYAIKAFKYNSIDYLLKPIGIAELKTALEKFRKLNPDQSAIKLKEIPGIYETMKKSHKSRFMVKMGENLASVKAEEVAHFIAEEGVVLLATTGGKRYAVDYTLDELGDMIDPAAFFRMNRKVIVNINTIQKISAYFNGRLKITCPFLPDADCIVSRERVNDFKKWLDG